MKWARTTGFDIILCTIRAGIDFLVLPVTTQLSEVYKKHIEPAGERLIQQLEKSLLFDLGAHRIFLHNSYLFEMIHC